MGREGAVTAIRDVKGLHYLRIMLQRRGADIPAIDLSDAVAGHPGAGAVGGDVGEVLDKRALSAYRAPGRPGPRPAHRASPADGHDCPSEQRHPGARIDRMGTP